MSVLFLRLLLRALRWRAATSFAVFVVAAVAVLAAVMGPIYLAAAAQQVMTDRLAAAPPSERDLVLTRDADALPQGGDLSREVRAGAAVPAATPWFGPAVVSQSSAVAFLAHGKTQYASRIAGLDGACAHLHFVQGACPSTPQGMAVSRRSASKVGWQLGDTVKVRTQHDNYAIALRITGVYDPVAASGDFWRPWNYFDQQDSLYDGQPPRLDTLFVDEEGLSERSPHIALHTVAEVPLEVGAVRTADESALRRTVTSAVTAVAAASYGQLYPTTAHTNLVGLLDGIDHELSLTRTLVDLATLQLALLAICVLYAIVSATATAHGSEVALAKLRGRRSVRVAAQGLAEPAVLVLLAAPVGALLAWVGVRALAPHVRIAVHVGFPNAALGVAAVTGLAAVLAAALAARRMVALPVSALLRRGTDQAGGRVGLLVADVAALVIAVAGLMQLHFGGVLTQGKPNPLSALAPTLLAVAVAVVGLRLVPFAARAVLVATRESSHLVPFLAVRQILRRANSTRLALLVSVALALATLAVSTWSVGRTNRDVRAANEAGADRVVTVQVPTGADLEALVRRADPSGREAMAAAILPVSSTELLAVDAARMQHVVAWRSDYSTSPLSTIAQKIDPRLPAPLTVSGMRLALTLRLETLTRGVPVGTAVTVSEPDHTVATVDLGALHPGTHTYSGELPGSCVHGCRIASIAFDPPSGYTPSVDSSDPASHPTLALTLLAIAGSGSPAAERAQLAAAVQDSARWRKGGGDGGLSVASRGGLYINSLPDENPLQWPYLVTGDLPDHLPAVVASSTAQTYRGQLGDVSAFGLDANAVPVAGKATAVVLPRLGRNGVITDLDLVRRSMTGPPASGVVQQVWLAAGASSAIMDRLHQAGVSVVSTDTAAAHRAVLERTGPAYADTVFLLAALAATVLAIGGAVLAALVTARRRSYELAALEAVGVLPSTLRRASAVEQGLLIGLGVLFGLVAGIGGSALALPSTPIFVSGTTGPPLEYGLPWSTLLVLMAAVVAVLAAVCLLMARVIEAQATAGRLREASA